MKTIAFLALSALATIAVAGTPEKSVRDAQNYDTLLRYYPKRALAAGEQGLVGFTIRLDKAGQPTACEVTHSSGHRQLDDETCQLMLIHGVFTPVKSAGGNKVASVHEGVVNWKIPGAAGPALPAAPMAVTASNAPEKMICKRELKTGSMASYERTCMTKRAWLLMSDQMKESWDELQGRKGNTNGN